MKELDPFASSFREWIVPIAIFVIGAIASFAAMEFTKLLQQRIDAKPVAEAGR